MNDDTNVTIELNSAEVLVLVEYLSRWLEGNEDTPAFVHEAERRVLWHIQNALESRFVEPFSPDYHDLIAKAHQEVTQE